MKVCMNGQGHMTKMAAMAINSKTFKNLLLQNQKAYDFETWHEALRNGVLQSHQIWYTGWGQGVDDLISF